MVSDHRRIPLPPELEPQPASVRERCLIMAARLHDMRFTWMGQRKVDFLEEVVWTLRDAAKELETKNE